MTIDSKKAISMWHGTKFFGNFTDIIRQNKIKVPLSFYVCLNFIFRYQDHGFLIIKEYQAGELTVG